MSDPCRHWSGDAAAVLWAVDTNAAVAYWLARARATLGLTPAGLPAPEVRFDLRGCAAGQALFSRRRDEADVIRINADLLASHPRDMIARTVPHEVAHIAIHRLHGRRVRPHGPEWQALMAAFGVPAETCHNLPVKPTRRLRRFAYVCGCEAPVWLTSIRHRRARRGTVYLCRRCGQRLTPAEHARPDGS